VQPPMLLGMEPSLAIFPSDPLALKGESSAFNK
jgi:hypothetical protein